MSQPMNPAAGVHPPNMASVPNPPHAAPPAGQHGAPHPQSNPGQHEYSQKIRHCLSLLRKTLQDLFEIAASAIHNNCNIDNGAQSGKAAEESLNIRFDKALEDFYGACNQMEMHLRTILECTIQTRDSNSYLPFQISKDSQTDIPTMNNQISYSEYLSIIKKQVNYAKSVYDILSDAVRQIKSEPLQMIPPPQLQQQPPQQLQQHPPQPQQPMPMQMGPQMNPQQMAPQMSAHMNPQMNPQMVPPQMGPHGPVSMPMQQPHMP